MRSISIYEGLIFLTTTVIVLKAQNVEVRQIDLPQEAYTCVKEAIPFLEEFYSCLTGNEKKEGSCLIPIEQNPEFQRIDAECGRVHKIMDRRQKAYVQYLFHKELPWWG